jgi:hypothetical protein
MNTCRRVIDSCDSEPSDSQNISKSKALFWVGISLQRRQGKILSIHKIIQ